jgi:proteasome lid subunit RPN8/RPN11
MKLILPLPIIERLKGELRGRRHEMGGILVGEYVEADTFRLVDISFQKNGGTVAHFVRDPLHHKAFLADFFARTGGNYRKFNYIGEWHSHPSFEPRPSGEDIATMFDLVGDPEVGVNFAILIIARLLRWNRVQISATLFRSGVMPEAISVEVDQEGAKPKASALSRLINFIRR